MTTIFKIEKNIEETSLENFEKTPYKNLVVLA
jgi:hypothetical protein